ncbi:F-box protein [Striga asiatica]|uniref:F-box protein n=1 Tax=Striga asiatica TaxID=4170 RepID=A0A5A7R634_STRAF|nr:F-box protein [Striga asiatica]
MAIMSLNLKSKLKPAVLNLCRTFSNAPLPICSKDKSKFIVPQFTGPGRLNCLLISIEDTAHKVEKYINYPKRFHNPVASCNGLVLFLFEGSYNKDTNTKTSPGEALWNPTTNELKILPPSPATLDPRTFSNAPLHVGSKYKSKFIVAQHTKTIGLGCLNYLVISIEDTAHQVEKYINYPKLYHNPVATCNGLVLLLFGGSYDEDTDTKTSPGEALWNPTTNELKILPPSPAILDPRDTYSKSSHMYFGFGFDSTSDDYKVIRFIEWNREGTNQVNRGHWLPVMAELNFHTIGVLFDQHMARVLFGQLQNVVPEAMALCCLLCRATAEIQVLLRRQQPFSGGTTESSYVAKLEKQ